MSFILISTLSLHDALPLISFAVGLVTVTWFIMRQLKLKEPILEFRVLKYKMFAISTAIGMVTFVAMIGAAIILPLFMQNMLGFSPFYSGLALLAGAVVQGLLNPITG